MNEFFLHKEFPQLQCIVIDDEDIAIEGVKSFIKKVDSLKLVGTGSSASEALTLLKRNKIDLMFLDVNMPDLTGLEFLETLENPPLAILTTAYSEYALDGFRLNVVDYLLKPYSFQRFFQAVEKAITTYQSQIVLKSDSNESKTLAYIRLGESYQQIDWTEIRYIEAMQNYLILHFKEQSFVIHQTMTSIGEMLPANLFFRIHKSYIINLTYIETINFGSLTINKTEIPISKYRRKEFMETVVYKKLISK